MVSKKKFRWKIAGKFQNNKNNNNVTVKMRDFPRKKIIKFKKLPGKIQRAVNRQQKKSDDYKTIFFC